MLRDDMIRKSMYCFAPVIMAEMLLCAASALFSDDMIRGLLAGHAAIIAMCLLMIRDDLRKHGRARAGLITDTDSEDCAETIGESHMDALPADRHPVLETAVWMCMACIISIGCTYLLNISGMAQTDIGYMKASKALEAAPVASRLLLTVAAAPVSEELLYRGIIYKRAAACFGEIPGFIVSVLIFAMSHGNATQAIYACVTGMLLTAACRRPHGLRLCVLLHMTINACSSIIFGS